MTQSLLERLEACEPEPHYATLINPDGPEAAALIRHLNERLVETQMLAFKWMEAHDKLHAGKPYDFPKPADLPDAIRELVEALEEARSGLESILPTGYPHPLIVKIDAALSRAKASHDDVQQVE